MPFGGIEQGVFKNMKRASKCLKSLSRNSRYDYLPCGDCYVLFHFRYKAMSVGVGINTVEVFHRENMGVAFCNVVYT